MVAQHICRECTSENTEKGYSDVLPSEVGEEVSDRTQDFYYMSVPAINRHLKPPPFQNFS